jgi:energy-coupling factor transporter transmembrane protein EcfT
METIKRYENYPIGIVILSNVVSLGIYVIGFLIIFRVGLVLSILYLLFILSLEYRLLRYHCTNCFYWGRICGFGKGRLSSWFFKRGDTSQFCMKGFTWKDMIPDLLVSLIPFVIGIIILILKFDIMLLSALLMLVLLTTTGNGYIRGTLTCRYCKQGELGCPADLLFNKGNKK